MQLHRDHWILKYVINKVSEVSLGRNFQFIMNKITFKTFTFKFIGPLLPTPLTPPQDRTAFFDSLTIGVTSWTFLHSHYTLDDADIGPLNSQVSAYPDPLLVLS